MYLAASVLVLLLAGLYAADARPEGAPAPTCATLSPDSPHPAGGLQTTPVPYEIDLTVFEDNNGTLQYNPGRVYTRDVVTFRGFLVRARLAADDSFLTNAPFAVIAGQTNTRTSTCTPANSGITHSNAQLPRAELTEVLFQWTAPPEGTGALSFGFAVVQVFDVYWAAQMSDTLEEAPVVTATPTTPTPTTPASASEPSASPIPTVVTPEPSTTPGPETTAPTEENPSVASASGVLLSGLSILLAMLATLLLL